MMADTPFHQRSLNNGWFADYSTGRGWMNASPEPFGTIKYRMFGKTLCAAIARCPEAPAELTRIVVHGS